MRDQRQLKNGNLHEILKLDTQWTLWTPCCLTIEHLFHTIRMVGKASPSMSNNLVNIHTSAKFYYHSHPPFTLPNKNIRSSSFLEDAERSPRHGTNISSSSKSASLIPYYPIPVSYSRNRSSKNSAIFYSKLSKMPGAFASAKMPGAFLGTLRKEHSNLICSRRPGCLPGRRCRVHSSARCARNIRI